VAAGIRNPIKKQRKEQPKEKATWIKIRVNNWIVRLTIAAGEIPIIIDPEVNRQAEAGLVGVEGDNFLSTNYTNFKKKSTFFVPKS